MSSETIILVQHLRLDVIDAGREFASDVINFRSHCGGDALVELGADLVEVVLALLEALVKVLREGRSNSRCLFVYSGLDRGDDHGLELVLQS
eukprot:7555394-Pyramimonas_sp.AAC.1